MSKLPPSLGEYVILPIFIPPLPSFPVKATHCLYIKHHEPKIPTPSDVRSLFLVNVPIDSTETHFRAIFTTLVGAGRFESIIFENERRPSTPTTVVETTMKKDKNLKRKRGIEGKSMESTVCQLPKVWDRDLHRSGSTAVVVMVDQKSVEATLKAIRKVHKSGAYPIWGAGVEEKVPKLGSQRYLAHHTLRYPDKAVLQASVDAFMTEFNRREEEAARVAKRLRNVPDEDGFVTVTRGGRTGPARREEAEEARRKEAEKEERKKKSMGDFYRFQGRERRKEEQGELVRRFEEDRKRVENMRKERKGRFRPE
jgi:ribosomal RNA-processing protein 7